MFQVNGFHERTPDEVLGVTFSDVPPAETNGEEQDFIKADLHGTTLSHAINLRQVYDMNRFV